MKTLKLILITALLFVIGFFTPVTVLSLLFYGINFIIDGVWYITDVAKEVLTVISVIFGILLTIVTVGMYFEYENKEHFRIF